MHVSQQATSNMDHQMPMSTRRHLNEDGDYSSQPSKNSSADCRPEGHDDVTVSAEADMFSRLALNDTNIAHRPFDDSEADKGQAFQWLLSFESYAQLR